MSAVSRLVICNKALAVLGTSDRLASVDDASPRGALFRDLWHITRRAVLASHPWNICVTRTMIEADPERAIDDRYRFRLPADCLRWLPPAIDDYLAPDLEHEGVFLLSSEPGPVAIRFIADNDDVASWPPLLAEAMVYRLAFDMAEAIAASQSMRDRMDEKFAMIIGQARVADGLATGHRRQASLFRPGGLAMARHIRGGIEY